MMHVPSVLMVESVHAPMYPKMKTIVLSFHNEIAHDDSLVNAPIRPLQSRKHRRHKKKRTLKS